MHPTRRVKTVEPEIHDRHFYDNNRVEILLRLVLLEHIENFYDDPIALSLDDAAGPTEDSALVKQHVQTLSGACSKLGINYKEYVVSHCSPYEIYRVNQLMRNEPIEEFSSWIAK